MINGITAGKTLKTLAAEFDCDHTAILRRAQKHPDYQISLQSSLQAKMEQREEELECADQNVTVTRADRLLGHARWLAERSCPDRWGQTKPGAGAVQVNIVIAKPDDAPHNVVVESISHVHETQVTDNA